MHDPYVIRIRSLCQPTFEPAFIPPDGRGLAELMHRAFIQLICIRIRIVKTNDFMPQIITRCGDKVPDTGRSATQ